MGTVIQEQLPRDLSVSALHYLMAGVFVVSSSPDELPSYIAHDDPLSDLVRQYMKALLAYDKASAGKVILDAAERGVPVRAIYDHVFARVQREIGRLWQLNKLTVAEEHYCTAATQIIMGQLSRYIPAPKKHGRVMVGACATGDLHELGSHMLCDVFEMEGWDTTFVGANVPISSAVRMVRARRAEVLAISASISYHIGAVEKLIATLRASAEFDRVKILVGGAAFETEGLWKKIGADAYARTPDEAVAAVE
jgi:methanogenic corrinoid protein MtbC1